MVNVAIAGRLYDTRKWKRISHLTSEETVVPQETLRAVVYGKRDSCIWMWFASYVLDRRVVVAASSHAERNMKTLTHVGSCASFISVPFPFRSLSSVLRSRLLFLRYSYRIQIPQSHQRSLQSQTPGLQILTLPTESGLNVLPTIRHLIPTITVLQC